VISCQQFSPLLHSNIPFVAYAVRALTPLKMKNKTKYSDDDESRILGLAKEEVHITIEILEYVPHAVVSKTIINKTTGNISVSSFDAGEGLEPKISPFDIYIQIIDGAAQVGINDKSYKLRLGEGIIIPGHTLHRFQANEQFKMISTTIKSGYED
jgi:quercetin dioxygenase-like cupin family protein